MKLVSIELLGLSAHELPFVGHLTVLRIQAAQQQSRLSTGPGVVLQPEL